MAKWGEGDTRWINEEITNATPWSRERLRMLLLSQSIEKGSTRIEFSDFKKLEGEATANNRKAKLIFFFEWTIDINFIATIAGSEIEYKGSVEILNLSDENEAHETEISVHVDTSVERSSASVSTFSERRRRKKKEFATFSTTDQKFVDKLFCLFSDYIIYNK